MQFPLILAQNNFGNQPQPEMPTGMLICMMVFIFAVAAVAIASWWKIFTKAGQPGWASIIPIYNIVVILDIVNRPLWWIVLYFIPCVNIVVAVIVVIDLAKSFGKDIGFAIGLIVLGIIFLPILAFGSATYRRIPRPT